MKFSVADTAFLTLFVSAICSATPVPNANPDAIMHTVSQVNSLVLASAVASSSDVGFALATSGDHLNGLMKRKGGGGKGGSSGGKSSGSSGGRGSVSAPKVSSPGVSSVKGAGGPVFSTPRGSSYSGGGRSPYGVGRSAPSQSGMRAPVIVPVGYYPGYWYYPWPLWYYPYNDPWHYHNATTNQNETITVACVAQQYQESTCAANNDTDFINLMLGNGTWNGWNSTVMTVQLIDGIKTAVVNGSAANGTASISWGVPSVRAPPAFMLIAGVTMAAFMML